MARTVWKFHLEVTDGWQVVKTPASWELLTIAGQHGVPTLWAAVEEGPTIYERTFAVTGTGHPVPDGGVYVGSAQCPPFVWHVWEEVPF